MSLSAPPPTSRQHAARRDRLAIEAAGLGIWELDLATGRIGWNAPMHALYGLPTDHTPADFPAWLAHVHPQDRETLQAALARLHDAPGPLNLTFRILHADGEVRHVKSVTRLHHDEEHPAGWLVGSHEDITDPLDDRQRGAAQQPELASFFDISLSLMCITTLDGTFQAVNRAWQRVLGHEESDLRGHALLDLVHPDDRDSTRQVVAQLHRGRDVAGFINRLRRRDGHFLHIEWRATPRDGRIYATAHDVSERIALEQQLAAEKAHLQLIIDSLPSPIFVKDWQGRHTLANRSVARLFATTPGQMIGRTDAEMPLPRDIQEKFLRDDREVMTQGRAKSILEQPLVDARGDVHWYQVTKVPLLLDRPVEQRQVLGIATDVTERQRNEQRLKRQEQLYRSLVESQQDLIVRVDAYNRFTFVNDAYCRVFGKARATLLGSTFSHLVHEEDLPETLAAIERLKQPPHQRVTIVQRAMTTHGWRWLSWEDSAILDEAGQLLEIQAVGRDITELKQAQQRALSSSRAKSQFLANMSHEIRTPLNAIVGFGELLAQSGLDAEQQDWVDKVQTSSHLLLSIVNDVLDYSKIEAGKLTLERVAFTLEQLITQQQALFAVAAHDKGLRFSVRQAGEASPALLGDPLRLGQVLTNLVGNAIKFTQAGEITLTLEIASVSAHDCRLTCHVRDTGIGISAAQQRRLFDAFTQADSSTSRRFGGSGLGLVISRRLVEQMGGTLEIDSVPGQGSCFSVSLVLPRTEAPASVPAGGTASGDIRALIGRRVLLAEDNPINQALARRLLEDLGLEVSLASNGREALARLEEGPVDLVLMDLQMPEMDGFEAARRIRGHYPDLPIIALSAAVLAEEREQALREGMNEHLAKPIGSQQLATTLLRWLSATPARGAADPAADAHADAAWLEPLDTHGFDTQAGLSAAAADHDLYRQVLGVFRDQLEQRFAPLMRLEAGVVATPALLDALHTLKGSAGSVGAVDIAEQARRAEQLLKQHQHLRQADIEPLTHALQAARTALAKALPPAPGER